MNKKKKSKGFNKDWIVRVYDSQGINLLDYWEVNGKYEWEINEVAKKDVEKLGKMVGNWTVLPKN